MGTAIKYPVPDRVKTVSHITYTVLEETLNTAQSNPTELSRNFNFLYPGTLTLSPERQSARISKIANYCLTWSGTGCFIAVPI